MRRTFFVLFLGVSLFLSSVLQAAAGWHQWSQTTRNGAITNRALQDNGKQFGVEVECKGWVQNVVYAASNGAVWLPSNRPYPYEYMWYADPNVAGMTAYINWVKPGQILQMRIWSRKEQALVPHTTIVLSVDSGGLWVIDNNFVAPYTVGVHHWTFSDFRAQVGSYYSVYTIL